MQDRKMVSELVCEHCGIHFVGEYMSSDTIIKCGRYCGKQTSIIVVYNQYTDTYNWIPEVDGFVAYIIMCKNSKTYKGYTGYFKKRMVDHFNLEGCKTTARMLPDYILHYEVCPSKKEAIIKERYFKTLSGIDRIKRMLDPLNTIYPPNKQ